MTEPKAEYNAPAFDREPDGDDLNYLEGRSNEQLMLYALAMILNRVTVKPNFEDMRIALVKMLEDRAWLAESPPVESGKPTSESEGDAL